MNSGIQSSTQRASRLADPDPGHPAWYHDNPECDQDWTPAEECQPKSSPPAHRGASGNWLRSSLKRGLPPQKEIPVVGEDSNSGQDHAHAAKHQQMFQEQHTILPSAFLLRFERYLWCEKQTKDFSKDEFLDQQGDCQREDQSGDNCECCDCELHNLSLNELACLLSARFVGFCPGDNLIAADYRGDFLVAFRADINP